MIIHFNGPAGVGKLTVAKALAERLNARVIDNHSIIDLVTHCHERRVPGYFAMIKKLLNVLYDELSNRPKEDIFIFTNWLSSDHPEDRWRLDSLSDLAKKRDVPFVQIMLTCSIDENKKRITSEGRKQKGKWTDAEGLENACAASDVYHPPAEHSLIIDTTNNTPGQTVDAVIGYINNI